MDRVDRGMTRRDMLHGGASLAGLAAISGLVGACSPGPQQAAPSASLGPPETTTLRLPLIPACDPWYWYCEPFLREEGFTDLTFGSGSFSNGEADINVLYGNSFVGAIDSGTPIVALAGMHTGCIMVFARPGINSIADLRGKSIGINAKM